MSSENTHWLSLRKLHIKRRLLRKFSTSNIINGRSKMALFNYFQKVPRDQVPEIAASTGLKEKEEKQILHP